MWEKKKKKGMRVESGLFWGRERRPLDISKGAIWVIG
jgi:hypothetical protein